MAKKHHLTDLIEPQRKVPEYHTVYGYHGKVANKDCPICEHEQLAAIEDLYKDFTEEPRIAALFGGFTAEELLWHCEGRDLHNKRLKTNPDAIRRKLIEKGMEALESGEVTVKPELTAKILDHLDEREGRMPTRLPAGQAGAPVLVISGFPAPGGLLPEFTHDPIVATPVEQDEELEVEFIPEGEE